MVKKLVYCICLSFVVLFIVNSCVNDKFSVGDNLLTSNVRNVLIDTCTVELYTVMADSSVTSGLSRIFSGRYVSTDFGSTSAHSYIMFSLPTYSTAEFGAEATVKVRLDSVTLMLKYDTFHYGDTTRIQNINLHKLKKIIELDDKSQLYSTSSIPFEEEVWCSRSFNYPNEFYENDSILEVRLPDSFGEELFRMMHAGSDSLDSSENFQRYFKGLRISPSSDDNASINSFVLDGSYPVIRIYYHTYGAMTAEEKTMDIQAETSTAFTGLVYDRTGTQLESMTYNNNEISSGETNNTIFIQGLTGFYVKMKFPYINDILKTGDYVDIASAYLYVFPVKGTYNEFTPLPNDLVLNYLDESGNPMDIYTDGDATEVQSGTLTNNYLFDESYYAFDISGYLKYELGNFGVNSTTLQLLLKDEDNNKTLKSLVIGDSRHSVNNMILQIYYMTYDY